MNKRLQNFACRDCPIRHRAVCAECSDDELATLERIKRYVTVPKGGTLAAAGEQLEHLSSLVSGCASIAKTLEDGRRQMVGLLLPSDFIGRPGRAAVEFEIVAETEVTLCQFARGPFETIVRTSPNVAQRMLRMTLDELDVARAWQVLLGRATARERVAYFILTLIRREATEAGAAITAGPVALTLPLSREKIADFIGLTIETTSRQFTALKADGLIDMPKARQMVVPDVEALRAETFVDSDGSFLT